MRRGVNVDPALRDYILHRIGTLYFLTTLISFHSDRFAWLQAVQRSLTFTLALIRGPRVSVKRAAANSRFVITIFDEGAGTVFVRLTDTRHIDTLFVERGT